MDSKLDIPKPENLLAMRDAVIGQMQFAREYTLNLISAVPEDIWNVSPSGIPTHFAWQIGHLAVAQYGLMLFRQRGRAEADLELMPGWLRKRYSRGSTPIHETSETTGRDELLEILRKIHVASLSYVRDMPAEVLAEPTEMPFTAYPIKLGALLFCPLHESIHAGQIGLLRRAHGLDPVR